jgi:hypothetical protein
MNAELNSPQARAVAIDRQYQELLEMEVVTTADLQKKNKLYREYRKFCQTGVVGKSIK